MSTVGYLNVAAGAISVLLCAIAAIVDIRTYRIPNSIALIGVLSGFVLSALIYGLVAAQSDAIVSGLFEGLLSAFVGLLFTGLIFGLLVVLNFVGMGDLKLMLAVGALHRWPEAAWAVVHVTIAGGVVALIFAVGRGHLGRVFRNLWRLSQRAVGRNPTVELHRIPYGLAIFLGVLWTTLARYIPTLRFP